MSKKYLFRISLLTFIGVFFFSHGYAVYFDLGQTVVDTLIGSLMIALGLGCLVATFLTYHHRAELAPPPPRTQQVPPPPGAQQVPQPPRTQQTPPPPGTQQTPPPPR